MFKIGRNFHIIHMCEDLYALDKWYDDVFAVDRFMDHQFSDGLKRYGSLVLIGDLCIEPMQPSFDVEGWERAPVGRFWQRLGKRWHSIAWYVDNGEEGMAALLNSLVEEQVRTFDIDGGRWQGEEPPRVLFTHPRDTYTQLEFLPGPMTGDSRFKDGFDVSQWARHPLGLLKSSHVTLTVDDVDAARDRYVGSMGGTLLHETEMSLQASRSAFVAVGTDLVLELAQPLDKNTGMGADHAALGSSLYSVGLRVRDLGVAEEYLTGKGFRFAARDDHFLVSDPESSMGVVFTFTDWDVPGDPRPAWG